MALPNFIAEICDVVFNGRSSAEATGSVSPKAAQALMGAVSWPELIRRKRSFVKVDGKIYCVTVEPAKLTTSGDD